MMKINSLANIKYVDRIRYLRKICQDKRVLHLGATDSPVTKQAIKENGFLHLALSEVSEKIVGLDIDSSIIQWLADNHGINNILHGNIENPEDYPKESFDIVVAGEIFEHLSNPGKALDSIHYVISSSTKLVITVPNTYSIKGFLRSLNKHELIHPDHTLHHSPHTLKALLERHRFSVINYFSYVNGGKGAMALITNTLIRSNPQIAEGIGVICEPQ